MMTPSQDSAPPIGGVLETALYVEDMPRAVHFFADVLGLPVMLRTDRLTAFDAGASSVLLVFARGASQADVTGERGTVPGHDGAGPLHMALRISADAYDGWKARLEAHGVPLRGEMSWPAGGRSLYFEDPDGHVLELATPGLWANY
ncbi:catechol 2,3-dioxygenase-like lactoylglutathione lyase family enzyme [Luteimonas terrae]|uniref:Catechol 2,3-dioxygenase-like lactoylglutathione lyase family enzyme n=2 Tax=Luteimonas terrae TaxID=1530191 RepID=A0ABU1XVX0_9GAMM|nr:catechol 2,3-dioxygenase-like lactoylglutathione lyase family enzyme [Luteimonas terrae]